MHFMAPGKRFVMSGWMICMVIAMTGNGCSIIYVCFGLELDVISVTALKYLSRTLKLQQAAHLDKAVATIKCRHSSVQNTTCVYLSPRPIIA
jgi:hypothetical protein